MHILVSKISFFWSPKLLHYVVQMQCHQYFTITSINNYIEDQETDHPTIANTSARRSAHQVRRNARDSVGIGQPKSDIRSRFSFEPGFLCSSPITVLLRAKLFIFPRVSPQPFTKGTLHLTHSFFEYEGPPFQNSPSTSL